MTKYFKQENDGQQKINEFKSISTEGGKENY